MSTQDPHPRPPGVGLTKSQKKNQRRRQKKNPTSGSSEPPPLPSASWVPEDQKCVLASCDELSRFPPPEVANAIAVKRILREQKNLASNPVAGIVVVSQSPKVYHNRYYRGSIAGPGDSPYQGGTFEFELFLPSSYPMKPPKVRMLTKIYHPNIDKLGRICLDTLKGKWSPALTMGTVLLTIQALLSSPNPDDPLNEDAAKQWKENENAALLTARRVTQLYAMKA